MSRVPNDRYGVIRVILTRLPSLLVFPDKRTFSVSADMSQRCQQQTKKAATFDAVRRFSGHHTHPYVSGSYVKNFL
jgi:hypothetical protein